MASTFGFVLLLLCIVGVMCMKSYGDELINGEGTITVLNLNTNISAVELPESRAQNVPIDIRKHDLEGHDSADMKQKLKKHAKKKKSKGGMEKYHSMLLFPALLTTALIPFIVMAIKLLLIKGAVIGKIALALMVISYFRRPSNGGGVHDHYMTDIMSEHYGYHKIDEPGIYVNK